MTHGTILLTSTDEKGEVLLQTSHDGHTGDALKMLLDLPRFVAAQSWYAKVIVRCEKDITIDTVRDFGKCQGDFGSIYLLGVAHWCVSYHFDRWHIIPKEFQSYLSDYDRKDRHHLHVDIDPYLWFEDVDNSEKECGILIATDFKEYKNSIMNWEPRVTLANWIKNANKGMPRDAKIVPIWRGVKKGIFLPFYERFVQEVYKEAKLLQEALKSDQGA
jgi:hypothetical protein